MKDKFMQRHSDKMFLLDKFLNKQYHVFSNKAFAKD